MVAARLTGKALEELDSLSRLFSLTRAQAMAELASMTYHIVNTFQGLAREQPGEAVRLATLLMNVLSGQEVEERELGLPLQLLRRLRDTDPGNFARRVGWFVGLLEAAGKNPGVQ